MGSLLFVRCVGQLSFRCTRFVVILIAVVRRSKCDFLQRLVFKSTDWCYVEGGVGGVA